jgi:DNA polymerase III delta subunit
MLYVFHGTDTYTVADKANRLVAGLVRKFPDVQVFTFEGDFIEESALDELVEARGLFIEKQIIVLKQPFIKAESRDLILARIKNFGLSQNIFVLSEGKLLADQKRALTKHAEKIEEYKSEGKKEEKFNVFALSDALGAHNKKVLWTGYVEARRAGVAAEPIHGMLHWAIRSMLLADRAKSPEESGQKPFIYSKFKRYAQNYGEDALRQHSRELITIYHDARRGVHELDTALERWVLGL